MSIMMAMMTGMIIIDMVAMRMRMEAMRTCNKSEKLSSVGENAGQAAIRCNKLEFLA